MPRLPAITVCEANTEEWLEARYTGIGSSESAAAAGMSTWATPLHIYSRKRRLLQDKDANFRMRWGRHSEPFVVNEFSLATGLAVKTAPFPLVRHPLLPWILATPDAQMIDESLLECKTTDPMNRKDYGEADTDEVPVEYIFQCQQQMEVVDVALCHLAVMIGNNPPKTFKIHRNPHLIEMMLDAEKELWQRIQDGNPPEPNWEHSRTPQLIKEMWGVTQKVVVLDDAAREIWLEQKDLGQEIKQSQDRRDVLRAQFAHLMGDAGIARLPNYDKEVRRLMMAGGHREFDVPPYPDMRERKVTE